MSRSENIEAIVVEYPFEREPTHKTIEGLRAVLEKKDWRRLKRMRRKIEEFLQRQLLK